MRFLLAALAMAAGLRALPADAACNPVSSAFCTSMQGNTCFIDSKQCPVVAGSTLDFGTKSVVLRQGSTLNVGAGTMTIIADSLELQPGTALLGPGGSIIVHTVDNIAVLRPSQGTSARIDVADPILAQRIELVSSSGTIQIDGILDARGTYAEGSGGSIDVTGAQVNVSGTIRTDGGLLGSGGPISVDARVGNVNISGTIDGFGGSGGPVDLTAEGTVTTTATGQIDLRATAAGGDGGLLDILTNSGSISLEGKISLQGDAGTDLEGGGNGGEMNVFSAAGLTLLAAFDLSGAPPDGQGGDVFLMSTLDTVQTGFIQLQGRGGESDGGTIEFDSRKGLRLGPIDAHGGGNLPDSGGAVQAIAWCDLTVPTGVTIVAEGDKGSIHLQSGGQVTATGTLKAGSPILIEYLSLPPITTGGNFQPALTTQQSSALTPCGGVPPTSCGDGGDDPGEECDDGNTVSCDGCSSVCRLETCGNDRVDCLALGPGDVPIFEACDDGNTTSGDTCHGDCSRLDNVCGDSHVDSAEECDTGDTTACDGCSATCQSESCGNGMVECLEECDPPGVAGCSADCLELIPLACGDDVQTPDEECDDGNTNDGDGCSHQCRLERCGNGTIDMGEDCDDFNVLGCDLCSPTCKAEECGNGILDCGEECDDGAANGTPGSHCLAELCRPAPICSTSGAEPCIPCAATVDCDPLNACGAAACEQGVCTPTTPPSCGNGNVCDGVETCDPATGCKGGTPLDCEDDDQCTTDSCDAAAGCSHVDLPRFELPKCRLRAVRDLVANAAGSDIAEKIRKKLLAKLTTADTKIGLASQAGSSVKKVRKGLKAALRQLQAATKLATKQRGKKIAAPLADAILTAIAPVPPLITQLTP